jgi:hypothetical protein
LKNKKKEKKTLSIENTIVCLNLTHKIILLGIKEFIIGIHNKLTKNSINSII